MEDGDEIICLRVVDKDSRFASDFSLRNGTYKKEAEQLLDKIKNKNKDREGEKEKAIVLAIEFAVGKVPEVFQRMVCLSPDRPTDVVNTTTSKYRQRTSI